MMNPELTSSTPALDRLARRLQDNGMVVVPYSDHIVIRLPIFASVQVRIIDGRLSCEPRFGFLPCDRATWLTVIGIAAVTAAAFLDLGITPLSMMLGLLGMSSGTRHGDSLSGDGVMHHARASGVHVDHGGTVERAASDWYIDGASSASRARRAGTADDVRRAPRGRGAASRSLGPPGITSAPAISLPRCYLVGSLRALTAT
jgi:hypothetical protein